MSYKQKFYVHIAIILAVLGGFIFLGYFLFGLIVDAGGAVTQSKADLAVLFAKKDQIKDLVKEYNAIKDVIPKLNDSLLRKDDALGFIMHVEDISMRTNVVHKIDAVDVGKSTDKSSSTASASFNVDLTGSFNDVLRFVYLIENTMPYASLQSLQLSDAGGAGTGGPGQSTTSNTEEMVSANASIKVYAR